MSDRWFPWIASRVLRLVLTCAVVVTLLVVLVDLAPGSSADLYVSPELPDDARERLIRYYGLDDPLPERIWRHLKRAANLRFGESHSIGRPALDVVLERLPATLTLSGLALLITFPLGVALGLGTARHPKRFAWLHQASLWVYAMPVFWLALIAQVLAPELGLPISGQSSPLAGEMSPWDARLDRLSRLILPVGVLVLNSCAAVARYTQTTATPLLQSSHLEAAKAWGLPERQRLGHHVLLLMAPPLIAVLALQIPRLVAGSVLIEHIFSWGGTGDLLYTAIQSQDVPLLTALFTLYAAAVSMSGSLSDGLTRWLDPRVREP